MRSRLFHAHVSAIENSLAEALPLLQGEFGDSLNIDKVRETIGTGALMHESMYTSRRVTIATIKGSPTNHQKLWIDIPRLYREAIEYKKNPPYIGEGI